jgi:tetratricopeptide (TPR) repeat protein
MPYDVFISYSRRANSQGRITEFVERISRDFESRAGRPLRPFFDLSEIQGMDDWRHRILQGLRESRLLLACLSLPYLQSEYCEWEFNEYVKNEVARGLVGEGVAPIYFVEVPGWQDKNFESRFPEWVAELRRRQYFDMRPWFHEGEQALREAVILGRMQHLNGRIAERIQRGERAEQSLGNVDAHNMHFIGRRTELRRLRETVALGKVGVLTAVHGLGGMGKTALAIEYAHAFAHEYGGGRWQVRCEGRDDLVAVITMLAPAVGIEFNEAEKSDTELQFQRVLSELQRLTNAREPHRCLLILDNVDRPRLLEPAQTHRLPATDWLHVIATTRLGENDLFARHQDRAFLPVDEMLEADALDLIESYQPGGRFSSPTEREAGHEIVQLLGRFTLAVEIAAVFLGQFAGDVSCGNFLERLKTEGLEGLESAAAQTGEGVRHGEKRLTATLQPTLERLTVPEMLAISFAALLPADHVSLPWIRAVLAQQFPELGHDAEPGHPDPWKNVLGRLLSLRFLQATGVIDSDGQPLIARMHRLLQEFMQGEVGEYIDGFEANLVAHARLRADFLWEGWVQHEHRWEVGALTAYAWQVMERSSPDATYLARLAFGPLQHLGNSVEAESLARRAVEIDERNLGPDHLTVAKDLNNLATLLQATNRVREAEAIYRRVLTIEEQSHDASNVAITLNNLAQLFKMTNRLAEAEPLMRRALEIEERRLGPEHPNVARDLNNLAMLLQATNRLSEAKPLMERALEIDKQSFGPYHPNVARGLNNLALLFHDMDRFAEAEQLYLRALEIDENSLGPYHHNIARDLNNLALLLRDTNRLAEAEPLMRRSLEMDERILGPDHPEVASRLNNLTQLLQTANRLTEAEPLIRRALAIDEQSFGIFHPSVARDLGNLAALLKATNRLDEAEPLMRRALEIEERSLGPHHPDVASSLGSLGLLLRDTNRLSEAEPLMRRALEIDERSLGPNHSDVGRDLNNLAHLLQAMNRLDEAEPLMWRVVDILEAKLGADHPHLGVALNNLAMLLQASNRPLEAEPLMLRALDLTERSLGRHHPEVAVRLNNLAHLFQATHRLSEAERLMRRVVAIFETSLGADHPDLATALANLAMMLQAMNRLAEAEPLMRRALTIDEKSLNPNDPTLAASLNNLAHLLMDANRLSEAEPLLRRAVEILLRFGFATGHEHQYFESAVRTYYGLLQQMGYNEEQIIAQLDRCKENASSFDSQ